MRSIARDVSVLNLSKPGFTSVSVNSWSPGDGLQHGGHAS